MYRFKKYILMGVIGLALVAGGCGEETVHSDSANMAPSGTPEPDQVTSNAHLYLYNAGYKTTDLKAREIRQFSRRDSTVATDLYVLFFDSMGKRISTLTAAHGYIREKDNFLAVSGSVVAIGEDSTLLRTEYLEWSTVRDSIVTDSFVTIIREREGDTLYGPRGMQSDSRLKNITFRQASGRLSDIEKGADEKR